MGLKFANNLAFFLRILPVEVLYEFLPFFKMFPGIYQVINEKLIEEIKSYPYGDNLENLVRNSIVNDIEEVRELILLGEKELFRDSERRDDSFFKKTELEVSLEIVIGGGKTISVIITFYPNSSDIDLIPKFKKNNELNVISRKYDKLKNDKLKFLNLIDKIYLVIKNEDGSGVGYTLLPGSKENLFIKLNQPDETSGYFYVHHWENMEVSNLIILNEQGDYRKSVYFENNGITTKIVKGSLYLEIPISTSSKENDIRLNDDFKFQVIRNLPGGSVSYSDVLYFEFSFDPPAVVFPSENKAKFFIQVSHEDIQSNLNLRYLDILNEGIYVTKEPVLFKLIYSPELTQYLGSKPWFLKLERSSWERVSSIPSDAFELTVYKEKEYYDYLKRIDDRIKYPEYPVAFLIDKETLPKLPFHPEIFGTNNYTENRKVYKMIRDYERKRLY